MSSAIQHRYSHTLSPKLLQSTTNCWQAPEQTYLPVFSRAGTARCVIVTISRRWASCVTAHIQRSTRQAFPSIQTGQRRAVMAKAWT